MIIEFNEITKKYRNVHALNSFSAQLHEGVYGLLGANGAGKTTLINILVGILKSDNGTILLDKKDVRTMGNNFLACIGYMPQYPQFYKDFTVMDFLNYMCALKNIPSKEGMERAKELLSIVNMTEAQNKKIGALSGGMRQRIGIIQAMLGEPTILILDEPTAGLDPQERIRFRNLISKFSKGRTVLLATHIVSDIEFIANEVIILKEGCLVTQNTPSALEAEIMGKVWKVSESDSENTINYEKFKISNMQRNGDAVSLRIIADSAPSLHAIKVQPNLEDVFLYHCGGGGKA